MFVIFSGFAHDAVMLWAHGVNRTIQQGDNPNDGFKVSKNIFSSSIQGVTGPVVIDGNGDRLEDLKVGGAGDGTNKSEAL